MPKKSTLDDNSVIYQPRQDLRLKEKLKDMPFRDKLTFLWEYYRFHALISIAGISLIVYIIYMIFTPDIETKFYAAFINNTIDSEVLETYRTDFYEYLQLDPKTEEIQFNSSFYLNADGEYSMNMQQVLTTYVAAQEIDVIIAPESEFASYAYYGYMDKLSDQLPTDIYSSLTDNFYISDSEEDTHKNVYGIYLSDTKLFRDYAVSNEPYILGIIVNGKNKENAVEFLRVLFSE